MAHRQGSLPASRRELIAILGGTAAACWVSCLVSWPLAAHAQQPSSPAVGFPSKTSRIIVPFTPGGSNDVVAREIATGLQARLNQTAVVENKPGGGGNIAYSYVAKSPPDGHIMLIAPASFTMRPASVAQSGLQSGHRFRADQSGRRRTVRHGRAGSLPVRTVKDFIALAKNSPDKLTFGSVGVGTPQHLGGELFKMHAGVDLDSCAVPRRHGGPAGSAGRAHRHVHRRHQFAAAADPGRQAARARRDQPQAHRLVAGRSDAWPRRLSRRRGRLGGRAGGAGRHAARHRRDAQPRDRKHHRQPGFHQRMAAIGVDVVGTTPAAYAKFISDDYAKWGKVVAAAGIKPE